MHVEYWYTGINRINGGIETTEKLEVYRCEICGNIVEVLHPGVGQLVCCDQPMNLLEEQTEESGMEKHVPVVEETIGDGLKVKVGAVPHPMEDKHYIEWIEVVTGNNVLRTFLKPNAKPETVFETNDDIIKTRAYCNIHRLWKGAKV